MAKRHWSERMGCICGWSTFSTTAEARHRHNFPILCKPAKKPKEPRAKKLLTAIQQKE